MYGIIDAGGMDYYDMAIAMEIEDIPYIDYGISDLYVMLLSTVLSFLGNKLSLFVWAVLAGLGIQNCIFGSQGKVTQEIIEEVNVAVEKAEKIEATNTERISNIRKDQASKPRYIENPLPLPKKHVAREMDYQYEVEEKDMKYDVEVPEDDDFDVE